MFCTQCGFQLARNSRYCHSCGARVAQSRQVETKPTATHDTATEIAQPPQPTTCPKCHRPNHVAASLCVYCRTDLSLSPHSPSLWDWTMQDGWRLAAIAAARGVLGVGILIGSALGIIRVIALISSGSIASVLVALSLVGDVVLALGAVGCTIGLVFVASVAAMKWHDLTKLVALMLAVLLGLFLGVIGEGVSEAAFAYLKASPSSLTTPLLSALTHSTEARQEAASGSTGVGPPFPSSTRTASVSAPLDLPVGFEVEVRADLGLSFARPAAWEAFDVESKATGKVVLWAQAEQAHKGSFNVQYTRWDPAWGAIPGPEVLLQAAMAGPDWKQISQSPGYEVVKDVFEIRIDSERGAGIMYRSDWPKENWVYAIEVIVSKPTRVWWFQWGASLAYEQEIRGIYQQMLPTIRVTEN